MRLPNKAVVFGAGALVLAAAGASGFLASQAIGLGTATGPPTTTTTVSVGAGPTGPEGPPGPPGPPGPGLTMRGTVATPADLPATGNTKGDAYIVSSDGSLRVWDGNSWVSGGPVGGTGGGPADCPSGSTWEAVELNHPGGHVTLWSCVAS